MSRKKPLTVPLNARAAIWADAADWLRLKGHTAAAEEIERMLKRSLKPKLALVLRGKP